MANGPYTTYQIAKPEFITQKYEMPAAITQAERATLKQQKKILNELNVRIKSVQEAALREKDKRKTPFLDAFLDIGELVPGWGALASVAEDTIKSRRRRKSAEHLLDMPYERFDKLFVAPQSKEAKEQALAYQGKPSDDWKAGLRGGLENLIGQAMGGGITPGAGPLSQLFGGVGPSFQGMDFLGKGGGWKRNPLKTLGYNVGELMKPAGVLGSNLGDILKTRLGMGDVDFGDEGWFQNFLTQLGGQQAMSNLTGPKVDIQNLIALMQEQAGQRKYFNI